MSDCINASLRISVSSKGFKKIKKSGSRGPFNVYCTMMYRYVYNVSRNRHHKVADAWLKKCILRKSKSKIISLFLYLCKKLLDWTQSYLQQLRKQCWNNEMVTRFANYYNHSHYKCNSPCNVCCIYKIVNIMAIRYIMHFYYRTIMNSSL